MIIVLTCAEFEGEPFLRSLLDSGAGQAVLVTSPRPAAALREMGLAKDTWRIKGLASIGELRRRVAGTNEPVWVVTGPDHGDLAYRRFFIRRRLSAPWLVPKGERAELVRIGPRGEVLARLPRQTRAALAVRFYPRDLGLVLLWALFAIASVPLVLFTLLRLLPGLLWTEARAAVRGGKPVKQAERKSQ